MLCHGVLCIFLTIPLSYAAVLFYFGQYEKLLRYGKLATSYIFAAHFFGSSYSLRLLSHEVPFCLYNEHVVPDDVYAAVCAS